VELPLAGDGVDPVAEPAGDGSDGWLDPAVGGQVRRWRGRAVTGGTRGGGGAGESGDDLQGGGPVPLVVVGVCVALCLVRRQGRFEGLPAVDGEQGAVEVGGRRRGVHAVGVAAPGAVVALLEQAPAVRADAVAVVQDPQPGLAHRGHDGDELRASRDPEGAPGVDDGCGVAQLLRAIARDLSHRHAARVEHDRSTARGTGRRWLEGYACDAAAEQQRDGRDAADETSHGRGPSCGS
jgi:hypothetical protein